MFLGKRLLLECFSLNWGVVKWVLENLSAQPSKDTPTFVLLCVSWVSEIMTTLLCWILALQQTTYKTMTIHHNAIKCSHGCQGSFNRENSEFDNKILMQIILLFLYLYTVRCKTKNIYTYIKGYKDCNFIQNGFICSFITCHKSLKEWNIIIYSVI